MGVKINPLKQVAAGACRPGALGIGYRPFPLPLKPPPRSQGGVANQFGWKVMDGYAIAINVGVALTDVLLLNPTTGDLGNL